MFISEYELALGIYINIFDITNATEVCADR